MWTRSEFRFFCVCHKIMIFICNFLRICHPQILFAGKNAFLWKLFWLLSERRIQSNCALWIWSILRWRWQFAWKHIRDHILRMVFTLVEFYEVWEENACYKLLIILHKNRFKHNKTQQVSKMYWKFEYFAITIKLIWFLCILIFK